MHENEIGTAITDEGERHADDERGALRRSLCLCASVRCK